VGGGVLLEEVVLAAVAGELELGADADGGAGSLGARDGLLDVAEVGVEVHRPLVEVARGNPQEPHLARYPDQGATPLLPLLLPTPESRPPACEARWFGLRRAPGRGLKAAVEECFVSAFRGEVV